MSSVDNRELFDDISQFLERATPPQARAVRYLSDARLALLELKLRGQLGETDDLRAQQSAEFIVGQRYDHLQALRRQIPENMQQESFIWLGIRALGGQVAKLNPFRSFKHFPGI